MFKYIMMQWKHKKIILSLMVIGFFVGSLAVLGVVSAVCIFMEKHKKKNQVIR